MTNRRGGYLSRPVNLFMTCFVSAGSYGLVSFCPYYPY